MSYQKLEQVDLEISDPEPIANEPKWTVKRVSLVLLAVAGVAGVVGATSKSYLDQAVALHANDLVQSYCTWNANSDVNVSIAASDRRLSEYDSIDAVGNKGEKNECFLYSYVGECTRVSLAPAIPCRTFVSRLCALPSDGLVTQRASSCS